MTTFVPSVSRSFVIWRDGKEFNRRLCGWLDTFIMSMETINYLKGTWNFFFNIKFNKVVVFEKVKLNREKSWKENNFKLAFPLKVKQFDKKLSKAPSCLRSSEWKLDKKNPFSEKSFNFFQRKAQRGEEYFTSSNLKASSRFVSSSWSSINSTRLPNESAATELQYWITL